MSLSPSKATPAASNEPSFPSVMTAFQDWVKDLEDEQVVKESIRNSVRELEASGRELAALLQKVHHASGYSNLPAVVSEVEELFKSKIQGHFSMYIPMVKCVKYMYIVQLVC